MAGNISDCLVGIRQSIENNDGFGFAHWMGDVHSSKGSIGRQIDMIDNLEQFVERSVPEPFAELVFLQFMALRSISVEKVENALEFQEKLVTAAVKILRDLKGNWFIPVLEKLTRDLRLSAEIVDTRRLARRERADRLEEAGRIFHRAFSTMLMDRSIGPESKRWGALAVTNQMFKIYFRLNHLRLCSPLIRSVEETKEFPLFSEFPRPHAVTFAFYAGTVAMVEENLEKAESLLNFAFEHCHERYAHNKRLILENLIPVRLLRGSSPSEALLEKYGLIEFRDLRMAVRRGDVRGFEQCLVRHETFFIRKGIYLVLQRLHMVVCRNLFRKCHQILGKNQIPLDILAHVMKQKGQDISLDELECIVANLIFKNYIKGYISHSKRVLVVSTKLAFPSLRKK